MKLQNSYSFVLAALLIASVQRAGAAQPAGVPPPAELRRSAMAVLAPLPDTMPGAEADTPEQIVLGKKLFNDTRLSANQSQSCNTCHRVDARRGGSDNEQFSLGAFGKRGGRNAPTVLNAGFHLAQFWDGRAATLEEQAKGPVLNPVEMAMPSPDQVLQRLQQAAEYPRLFARAFPKAKPAITYDNVARAIAAYERTLVTHDRFDDFLKGDDHALNRIEMKGLQLFLTAGCTTCHNGPILGGNSFQKLGLVNAYPKAKDIGRAEVTKTEEDKFKFKVPSLRNIALTAPYFHDGEARELKSAVEQMAHLQLGRTLADSEADDLVHFLQSLTDKARN